MVMYNPDGSRGAMCGNGIRCVARYVYDQGYIASDRFTVESMGSVKNIELSLSGNTVESVRVDMGAPVINAADIPVVSDSKQVISRAVTLGGRDFEMTCVSMGNPHAVMFIQENPRDFALETFGPLFENDAMFPDRVNAEFARVLNKKRSKCAFGSAARAKRLPAERARAPRVLRRFLTDIRKRKLPFICSAGILKSAGAAQ